MQINVKSMNITGEGEDDALHSDCREEWIVTLHVKARPVHHGI
jgi:hypothetical protein